MTDGILLPGWDCSNPVCGVFNGSGKTELTHCRCCGVPRPSDLDLAFKRLQKTHEQAIANLSSVQARCTELVLENRRLKGQARERIRDVLQEQLPPGIGVPDIAATFSDLIVAALERP